ncbi:MAG: glyoxalase/bleomycin resistance/dioxygenase family protein [Paenibacillaceae bacterium]|nr:MAG: glyoxalase/bleomycin resistance/dioxygenase family protein [Paenibacillaceae bacterium]
MITHFADLALHTVSLEGVRQFYNGLLGIPVVFESDKEIRFQVTPFTTLTFTEAYEPVAPVHFAFEVPWSAFSDVIAYLKEAAGIPLLRWPDGREFVDLDGSGPEINAYFRDGDGHLLEVIAHRYVREDVLPQGGPLKVLYLREVGFPVEDVSEFRGWLSGRFGMKLAKVFDDFTFAIGGTAHAVIASKQRRWIPIRMYALPPNMTVTFGVSGRHTLERIRELTAGEPILSSGEDELTIMRNDYRIRFAATDVPADIAVRLNLP